MQLTTVPTCAVLAIGICILGGCRQETPPKTPAIQATPAPQATPLRQAQAQTGEALFKQYCAPCHTDGGNVSDRERTLHSAALRRHSITTPGAIVNIMRNPGPRMIRFDKTTISDKEAMAIAEYILDTFK